MRTAQRFQPWVESVPAMPVSKSHTPPTPTPRNAPPGPALLCPTHTVSQLAPGQFELLVRLAPGCEAADGDFWMTFFGTSEASSPARATRVAPAMRSRATDTMRN